MNQETTDFPVTLTFTQQRLQELLITAFNGGVTYWCQIIKCVPDVSYHLAPFLSQGVLELRDLETQEVYTLTQSKLQEGLCKMALLYPRHFANFVTQEDDAETGDVFVQCCLFGKIIYG